MTSNWLGRTNSAPVVLVPEFESVDDELLPLQAIRKPVVSRQSKTNFGLLDMINLHWKAKLLA